MTKLDLSILSDSLLAHGHFKLVRYSEWIRDCPNGCCMENCVRVSAQLQRISQRPRRTNQV